MAGCLNKNRVMSRLLNRAVPCAALLAVSGVVVVALHTTRSNPADLRARRSVDAARAVESPGELQESALPAAQPDKARTPEAAEVSMRVDTPESRGGALRTLHSLDADPGAVHRATASLVDLLRRSPESVSAVVGSILDAESAGIEAGRLLSCLAAAGTTACQDGMIAVIEASQLGIARRRQALRSLAPLEHPAPNVDLLLARLIEEGGPLATDALQAWAIVGGRVRDRDPARFEAAAAQVREFLETAAGAAELQMALNAVGHLGPAEVPIRLLDATGEMDENVRVAAMRALRTIASPAAERALCRSVRDDRSESVRQSALESLAGRRRALGPESLLVVRTVAEADPSERVRRRAAEVLARIQDRDGQPVLADLRPPATRK
jgi:hypothetical protein